MEATDATQEDRAMTPEEIGTVVRTVRTYQGWTQETLAELAGLQTRTIQRVEQGQPSSLDTRRAIARAFRLEDLDYFNSLHSFPSEGELRRRKEAFDRDHVLLDAKKITGRELVLGLNCLQGYGCIVMSLGETPPAAQDGLAGIADFARDCLDVFDVASQSEILSYGDTMNELISDLAAEGFTVWAAHREISMTSDKWADPTPMRWKLTYLSVASVGQHVGKIIATRKVSIG